MFLIYRYTDTSSNCIKILDWIFLGYKTNGWVKPGYTHRYCGWRMDEKHSSWWWYSFSFPLWYALSCIHWSRSIYFIISFCSIVKIVFFNCRTSPSTSACCTDWWYRGFKYVCLYFKKLLWPLRVPFCPEKKDLIPFKLSNCCIAHSIICQIMLRTAHVRHFLSVNLSHWRSPSVLSLCYSWILSQLSLSLTEIGFGSLSLSQLIVGLYVKLFSILFLTSKGGSLVHLGHRVKKRVSHWVTECVRGWPNGVYLFAVLAMDCVGTPAMNMCFLILLWEIGIDSKHGASIPHVGIQA